MKYKLAKTAAANQMTDIRVGPPLEKLPDWASGDENADPRKISGLSGSMSGVTSSASWLAKALVTTLVTASAKSAVVLMLLADDAAGLGSALHRSADNKKLQVVLPFFSPKLAKSSFKRAWLDYEFKEKCEPSVCEGSYLPEAHAQTSMSLSSSASLDSLNSRLRRVYNSRLLAMKKKTTLRYLG